MTVTEEDRDGVDTIPISMVVATSSSPASTPTASDSTKINLQECSWSDINEDEDGNAAGVLGLQWEELSVKQLRILCAAFRIKGIRNSKKPEIIDKIMRTFQIRKAYNKLQSQQDRKPPAEDRVSRRQIQCPFRLLNIIFSDEFVEDFADLGNIANRQILDSGKAGNQQHFWERVAVAFSEEKESYGVLRFMDDEVLAANCHIDPSKIVVHDWSKLRRMWKGINADYKAALTRFTQSGTHDHNFFSFCNNKVETYYLRKYLDLRPNITATVEADLPQDCAISSESDARSYPGTTASTRKKGASEKGGSEIADALRDFQTGVMESELTKKRLLYMEEEREERKEEFMMKKRRNMMDDWTNLLGTIRTLRQDLQNPGLDNETRHEIMEDIGRLVKRKNQLANEIGMD